jgi:hypothetical protein
MFPNTCLAYRYWSKACPVFYVESVKGKRGDWGYTTDVNRAMLLSPYWQRRFNADCNAVGVSAQFVDRHVTGQPSHGIDTDDYPVCDPRD